MKKTKAKRAAAPQAVPVEQWGRDHWSTFAYIGTLVVGKEGEPDRDKMRCDIGRHPGLAGHIARLFTDKKYPTRLHDGSTLDDHDDWDCADDAERAGLLEWNGTGMHPVFALTERGWDVLRRLTQHKRGGGTFDTFSSVEAPAAPLSRRHGGGK